VTQGPQSFRMMVADGSSTPEGGVCSSCYDHFQAPFTATDQWQHFVFAWDSLQQLGFGDLQPQVDRSALYAVQFQYGARQDFELWIDDVAFTRGAGAVDDGYGTAGAAGHRPGGPAASNLRPRGGGGCALGRVGRGRLNILLVTALAGLAVLRGRRRRRGPVGGR